MRIALIGGVLFEHDAISFSLGSKLDILRSLAAGGADVEVRAFVHDTDTDDPDVVPLPHAWSLLRDPWFHEADVHIFEFGIHFGLFDAVHLLPPSALVLGVFHNITPLELMSDPEGCDVVRRSFRQVHNLSRCREVICVSEFNAASLQAMGVDDVPTSVLELPPSRAALPRTDRSDGRVGLLYVGRLVQAKGIFDALAALRIAIEAGASDLHLTIAGSPRFSDRLLVATLQELIDDHHLADSVEVLLQPTDDDLAARFAHADALLLPSYHEGYGMPVVEAMASGCHVICSDAGSLPGTAAGLGLLVPTGDVPALAEAMGRYYLSRRAAATRADMVVPCELGELPHAEWRERAAEVVARRSYESYARGLVATLERCTGRSLRADVARAG
jgi:glycosyltransferase involved in cell wall biosynthesis